jgi:diguanylate cyclase (GGDEF)-like protein
VYNEKLALAILLRLAEEFPRKSQINDLRQSLSEFSSVSEEEWLVALSALIDLGHAKGRVLPSGMGEIPAAIANIEITELGRGFVEQSQQVPAANSGDMDDLLPIFAKRQFEKDLVTFAVDASAPLSLLFIDLDHFKSVNDTFNHLVGNEVLVGTAETLRIVCDKKGCCYRWGGEEFAVLLPNFSLSEAQTSAERVREAICRIKFKNYQNSTKTRNGVANYGETSTTTKDLVRDADDAMLTAKKGGRNQVRLANRLSEVVSPVAGVAAKPTKQTIKAQLATFLKEGLEIQKGLHYSNFGSIRQKQEWEHRIDEYLEKNLDGSYTVRFQTPGHPPTAYPEGINSKMMAPWAETGAKMAMLGNFLLELLV